MKVLATQRRRGEIILLVGLPVVSLVSGMAYARAASPGEIVPRTYSFDFQGLCAEVRGADAIVEFEPKSWVPDSALGIDQTSKTWKRIIAHGAVLKSFGDGPLRAGDTLAVAVWYAKDDREFRELQENTHQFVWDLFSTRSSSVVLLERTRDTWQVARALYPDSIFITEYLRASGLPIRESARALIRLFLSEYIDSEEGHWGHLRVALDDLDRLEARDSSIANVWQSELSDRPSRRVCPGRLFDIDLIRRLARYMTSDHKRDCVRNLLSMYEDVLKQDRAFQRHPPPRSYELNAEQARYFGVAAFKSLIPQALSALLVEQDSPWERPEASVARARQYLEESKKAKRR